jgi:serpin B
VKPALLTVAVLAVAFASLACGDDSDGPPATNSPGGGDSPGLTNTPGATVAGFDLLTADVVRAGFDPADAAGAAVAGAALGFDILSALAEGDNGNLAISPYSIQVALAMARAGAAGATLDEMDAVLRTAGPGDFDASLNALDQLLLSRAGEYEIGDGKLARLELTTANSLWGQRDFAFEDAFLEQLARWYGAGMRTVDYVNATEDARQAINGWVAEQTRERIPELIPPGVLSDFTRLVLTNAVYLNAPWAAQFDPGETSDGHFTRLDGATVEVPLMHIARKYNYAEGSNFAAVELPYAGNGLAMLLVVPDVGEFEAVQGDLDAEMLASIARDLSTYQVTLDMPRFEFRTQAPLEDILTELGMPLAFDPERADFTGIADVPDGNLFINDVLHEAFISVDEEGTEAAAATAVIFDTTSAPPPAELRIDRPFFFAIRDTESGALLFLGRVMDPSQR